MVNKQSQSKGKDNTVFGESVKELTEKMYKQGQTPKEAMGVSSSYLENAYSQAYRFYNTGKYGEASHLFRILVMFNAMEPKYMMGVAACHHMMKEYASAIEAYTMCLVLDPKNPIPHYHSSDCYAQMKEHLSALLCLELAIKVCGSKAEYSKLKERAQLSLEGFKQQAYTNPLSENPLSTRDLKANAYKFALD